MQDQNLNKYPMEKNEFDRKEAQSIIKQHRDSGKTNKEIFNLLQKRYAVLI